MFPWRYSFLKKNPFLRATIVIFALCPSCKVNQIVVPTKIRQISNLWISGGFSIGHSWSKRGWKGQNCWHCHSDSAKMIAEIMSKALKHNKILFTFICAIIYPVSCKIQWANIVLTYSIINKFFPTKYPQHKSYSIPRWF